MPIAARALRIFRRRLAPSAEDVGSRLKQLDEVLTELMTTPEIAQGSVGPEVAGLHDAVEHIKKRLPMNGDGTINGAVWDNDAVWTPDRKRSAYWDLCRIWQLARAINASEIAVGRKYFAVFLALFALTGLAYLAWHRSPSPVPADVAADIVDVERLLKTAETRLGALRSAKEGEAEEARRHLQALSPQLRDAVVKIRPPYESLRGLAAVLSDIDTGQIAASKSFGEFREDMRLRLSSARPTRWPHIPDRWLEIAWWAELGTLVGILFYIAGVLSSGVFRVEEVSMMWTEAFIAPIVIPAVFFLFQYIGLADPSRSATTVKLGVAFLLGFSIRRTVGLLDLAKKKILPDPDTAPAPAKTGAVAAHRVPTTTTITASAQRPPANAPATFTVSVGSATANAGVPTGTVSLKQNGGVISAALPLDAKGMASGAPPLAAGTYTITAEYAGDATFAGSSGQLRHEVI